MTARTTEGYADLRAMYVIDADPGDPWGTCMAWRFAIAGTLAAADEDVPPAWQYRRSPVDNRDVEEMAAEWSGSDHAEMTVAGGYLDGLWDADDLRSFGEILSRYAAWCRAAGRDY